MAGIQWAADLLPALKATHTGEGKLNIIRTAMLARHADPRFLHLPETDPARHLTAAEAVAALEQGGAPELTVAKARALVETGRWEEPPPPVHPAELLPAPPAGAAPVREPLPAPAAPPLQTIAGVENLSAGPAVVGALPVEKVVKGSGGRGKATVG